MQKILGFMFVLVISAIPVGADATTIVDSLGVATPSTQFSVFGTGGQGIISNSFAGPEFTLTAPTVLTEIGGFVNNCDVIIAGVPQCPITLPFIVQIHPSINGVPDPFTVLASFVLSHDNDPLVVSYEFAAMNFTLAAGTYFALFAPQGSDAGFLLGSATDPFIYQPGVVTLGVLDPSTGRSFIAQVPAAVRILGVSRQNVCPQSQGFWKNNPDAWLVTSLTLGRQTYTQAQLLTILTTPVRGDASLILADQLIAAKLNIANGADPTPISATITDADSLLSQFGSNRLPYNVRTSSAIGQQMVNDANVLDRYNNGDLTPDCQP